MKKPKRMRPVLARKMAEDALLAGFAHTSRSTSFWSHVRKTESCWEWTGNKNQDGYGRLNFYGHWLRAHRVAYQLYREEIPEGMQIDHLCRNRACVNPEHMEVVTSRENTMRGDTPALRNSQKESCSNGHPFNAQNTYRRPRNGGRTCRLCQRGRSARWRVRITEIRPRRKR